MVNHFHTHLPAQPCALCAAPSARGLCEPCCDDLDWIAHGCENCGLPLPQPGLCAFCQIQPPPFRRCISPLAYAPPVSHLIGAFKYQRKLLYGRILSELLIRRLRDEPFDAVDAIVPTPLHWRRRWWRGFNQAELIGDELSRGLGIPLRARWLKRVRPTPRQQDLTAEERRRNLRGAFAATRPLPGLRIALVDDVVTTGATVAEISRVLLDAGATSVQVWCLARTP